jgi:anti-sigma factor RsiW
MDPTILERLLIDRRLGELSPDAASLLDAYLQMNPDARAIEAEVTATIDAAQRVLKDERPAQDWPMPTLSMPSATGMSGSTPFPWPAWQWYRRLAVAAAIGLAFFLGSRLAPGPTPVLVENRPRTNAVVTQEKPTEGFWSLRRLQKNVPPASGKDRQHVTWPAPFSKPRIGDRT